MANDHGNCPHCGVDLNGGSIWETFYHRALEYGINYDLEGKYSREARTVTDEEAQAEATRAAEMYGATRTEGQWGRAISQYCMERDRTVSYQCPDCGGTWSL